MLRFPFALLLSFTASLSCQAATSLAGAWTGNDRAAEAIYETVVIVGDTIAWGSAGNPNGGRCVMTWREVFAGRGENYPGNQQAPVAGRIFEVRVLELAPVDCARSARYLLFALPSDAVPAGGYAEFVSFDEHWSLTGWHNLTRARVANE